jgi:NAD(P)-dependent dehydrogenase (short-subunit alcohol dehydrogenase family)
LSAEGHQVYATFQRKSLLNRDLVTYHELNVLDESLDFTFLPEILDGLVYCPGAISLKPFARITPKEFIADYQLQVLGAIKVIQSVLPNLKVSPSASIVLFSTVAAQLGLNFHTLVSTSKAAIEGLTKSLSAELAPSIRVNCIAPSLINTPLAASLLNTEQKVEANAQRHPLKRIGSVNDISNMVTFLLSQKSGWITGQVMKVDGGMGSVK